MPKIPDLRQRFDPPEEIIEAGKNGNLIFFIGAGASMLLKFPSWGGLASKALEDLRTNDFLNYSEIQQLKELDAKKQLSIALSIAEENQFELDLVKHLKGEDEGNSIYKAINDIGCPCVTTNYDLLLSPRFTDIKDGSNTIKPVNRVFDRESFYSNLLNEPGTVVHLHGAICKPETMIVTTRDYLEHYDHEKVKNFLGELFEKKTVVFIGYGLEEAEILEHILRRGMAKKSAEKRRFALQGYFFSQTPLYENLHKYYKNSFGVHLLGFVKDHEDYKCLESIIKSWVNLIKINKPPLAEDYDFMIEVLGDE